MHSLKRSPSTDITSSQDQMNNLKLSEIEHMVIKDAHGVPYTG
jgi:hypothetical protein